jgi:hypothetical protein
MLAVMRSAAQESASTDLRYLDTSCTVGFGRYDGGQIPSESDGLWKSSYGLAMRSGMPFTARLLQSAHQPVSALLTKEVPVRPVADVARITVRVLAVSAQWRDTSAFTGLQSKAESQQQHYSGVISKSAHIDAAAGCLVSMGQSVIGITCCAFAGDAIASSAIDGVVPKPVALQYDEAAAVPNFLTAADVLTQARGYARQAAPQTVLLRTATVTSALLATASCILSSLNVTVHVSVTRKSKHSLVGGTYVHQLMQDNNHDPTPAYLTAVRAGGVDTLISWHSSLQSPAMLCSGARFAATCVELGNTSVSSNAALQTERADICHSIVVPGLAMLASTTAFTSMLSVLVASGTLPVPSRATLCIDSIGAAIRGADRLNQACFCLMHPDTWITGACGDMSVLVTGGLGTLGGVMASWMVHNTSMFLQLVGRSGRSQTPAGALAHAATEQCITAVTAQRLDTSLASEAAQCTSCHSYAAGGAPVLGSLLHTSGVLQDVMLANQTAGSAWVPSAAKVYGVKCLHEGLTGCPMAFKVLFSSVASLLGSPGQTNYAAANAFLDATAQQQQHAGVIGVSVNWGAWEGAGMALQDASTARRMEKTGMNMVSVQEGLGLMRSLFGAYQQARYGHISAQVAANPFNWSVLLQRLGAVPRLFE